MATTTATTPTVRYRARGCRALSAIRWGLAQSTQSDALSTALPTPSLQRREESKSERPLDLGPEGIINESQEEWSGKTVFYLAYGSNLSHETFQGNRGIQPLSQMNVLVPELRLTFDLPGIPYTEPCFANSARRIPDDGCDDVAEISEKTPLFSDRSDYHKDEWKKGLVGVVYEVTLSDYAHIIGTEGGGAAYQDILVGCYPLVDPDTVPEHPTTEPFKAHTLFAPAVESPNPGDPPQKGGGLRRPDTSYAQPSSRYLKLITDGAEEHGLPQDYMEYLYSIRPYTMTTQRQRIGQFIFMTFWLPVILFVVKSAGLFQDKKGRSPPWFIAIQAAVMSGMWISYDTFFKNIFGDGERTIESDDAEQRCRYLPPRRGKLRKAPSVGAHEEKRGYGLVLD